MGKPCAAFARRGGEATIGVRTRRKSIREPNGSQFR